MKLKFTALLLVLVLSLSVLAGCTSKAPETGTDTNTPETGGQDTEVDAVTSPSQAVDEESFKKGISKDGNFIVITSGDLTFTEDLFVEGEFLNSSGAPVRSLALAQYDENNQPIRYRLTVPNLVISSENTLVEYGIIEGDVYVQAPGFRTKEATFEGNLYFASQELLDAFAPDEATTITEEIAVKEYNK